jgi:hypothetical protein
MQYGTQGAHTFAYVYFGGNQSIQRCPIGSRTSESRFPEEVLTSTVGSHPATLRLGQPLKITLSSFEPFLLLQTSLPPRPLLSSLSCRPERSPVLFAPVLLEISSAESGVSSQLVLSSALESEFNSPSTTPLSSSVVSWPVLVLESSRASSLCTVRPPQLLLLALICCPMQILIFLLFSFCRVRVLSQEVPRSHCRSLPVGYHYRSCGLIAFSCFACIT